MRKSRHWAIQALGEDHLRILESIIQNGVQTPEQQAEARHILLAYEITVLDGVQEDGKQEAIQSAASAAFDLGRITIETDPPERLVPSFISTTAMGMPAERRTEMQEWLGARAPDILRGAETRDRDLPDWPQTMELFIGTAWARILRTEGILRIQEEAAHLRKNQPERETKYLESLPERDRGGAALSLATLYLLVSATELTSQVMEHPNRELPIGNLLEQAREQIGPAIRLGPPREFAIATWTQTIARGITESEIEKPTGAADC